MFYGSHSINMDAKGRIAIPTRVRELLQEACADRIVVTAHTENRCLLIYPEPQWLEVLPKLEALPSFNKASRRVKLLMMGYATTFELEANGRVLLSPTLRDYAGMEKKLMLVGQGKSMELWCEEQFFQYIDSAADDDEAMPEGLQNLAL